MSSVTSIPRTSKSVTAKAESEYAKIVASESSRDQTLISKAVDSYLSRQQVTAEDYEDRVHSLREQFSNPAALQELRNKREGGVPVKTM